MNPPPNREVVIFNAALELPASQRDAYLLEACADHPALRPHIEALLRVHEEAGAFLEPRAAGTQASALGPDLRGANIGSAFALSEKPGDRIGRYKLLQQIGEGGCGVVYMAEQEEPVRRRVALKVIKLGMDTRRVIARFEAERQALALMDHPNIAKVLDAGATGAGRPYFVMELVRGIKITDYCDENQLPTEARLKLFTQVCHAIQHAHQKGILHRDIKPSNILVGDHDGVPVPKVIDFGIAKATTDQQLTDKTLFTALEQFMGTPAYMSPEQAKLSALDLDTRTDIYSLGVLLYELLTGKTPFDATRLLAAGLEEMRRSIREQDPERPSTALSTMLVADLATVAKHRQSDAPKLVHRIRGDLDWIVMKALEKDRTQRYETANGLAMDVQRHLENEPVEARPPSRLYRLQKSVRRHRAAFATAAAIGIVLLIGVVVSTSEAIRAQRSEQEQIRLRKQAESVSELFFVAQELNSQSRWKEAEATYRRALSIGRELYGNNHLQVAFTLCHLASTIEKQGRPAEAEPFYREALALVTRLLKSDNPQIVSMMLDQTYRLSVIGLLDQLASVLEKQGKTQELELVYRDALSGLSHTLGDHDVARGVLLDDFASRLLHIGEVTEAEKTCRQALDAQRQSQAGTDISYRLLSLRQLADILRRQGKISEAENFQREVRELTGGQPGTNK